MRDNSFLVIEESSFSYNESNEGLIDAMFSSLYVFQSKFEHNISRGSSGCFYLLKILNATVIDSIFHNNTAARYGSVMVAQD